MIRTAPMQSQSQEETDRSQEDKLQSLFSKLFLESAVSFFDGEPDEDFINVFDHMDLFPVEERRKTLEDFRRDLHLEENFAGDYGCMSEIVIQSEDFLENLGVPFLMFNLTSDEDRSDPTYSFRLDLFEVFCIGNDQFLVVLYVRNAQQSHMEMYMRFTKSVAMSVVNALLQVFEEYIGYPQGEPQTPNITESGLEEILTSGVNWIDVPQFKDSREATEAKLKELHFGN